MGCSFLQALLFPSQGKSSLFWTYQNARLQSLKPEANYFLHQRCQLNRCVQSEARKLKHSEAGENPCLCLQVKETQRKDISAFETHHSHQNWAYPSVSYSCIILATLAIRLWPTLSLQTKFMACPYPRNRLSCSLLYAEVVHQRWIHMVAGRPVAGKQLRHQANLPGREWPNLPGASSIHMFTWLWPNVWKCVKTSSLDDSCVLWI